MIAGSRATCMLTAAICLRNSGWIPMYGSPITMVIIGANYVRASGSPAIIWSNYAMSGTDSALILMAPPRAIQVTITDDTLAVDLEDGRTIAVPIGWFPRLAYGTAAERANVLIAGAGFGLYWPDLDED